MTNTELVETACARLRAASLPITFTAVAAHSGLSRTTLYRNPELRGVVEDHRRYNPASITCLLYTSPSPRDRTRSRMPSPA